MLETKTKIINNSDLNLRTIVHTFIVKLKTKESFRASFWQNPTSFCGLANMMDYYSDFNQAERSLLIKFLKYCNNTYLKDSKFNFETWIDSESDLSGWVVFPKILNKLIDITNNTDDKKLDNIQTDLYNKMSDYEKTVKTTDSFFSLPYKSIQKTRLDF